MAGEASGDVPGGGQRAGQVEECRKVRARHDRHAHERRFTHGFAQTLEQLADFSCVIRGGDHRAPAGACAWRVAVNVGNGIAVGELQRGVLFEKRNHLWAGLEEGINHCRLEVLAQFVFQVGARQCHVFDDAGAAGQGVAGHPGPAAGPCRGATENRILFHHNDFQAMPCRRDSGRQTGRTGADDQHITVDVGKNGRFGRHCEHSSGLLFWNLIPENIRGRRSRASLWRTKRAVIGRRVPDFAFGRLSSRIEQILRGSSHGRQSDRTCFQCA